jgi:hypothetical protein
MRIGASAGSVVNMWARDKSLTDFVMLHISNLAQWWWPAHRRGLATTQDWFIALLSRTTSFLSWYVIPADQYLAIYHGAHKVTNWQC